MIEKSLNQTKIYKILTFIRIVSLCLIFTSIFVLVSYYNSSNVDAVGKKGPIMVSLGDSYSAGEGIPPFGKMKSTKDKINDESEDWLAHRSTDSWPGMLKIKSLSKKKTMSKYRNRNWYFFAQSGAKTEHLNGTIDEKTKEIKGINKEYSRDGISGDKDLTPQLALFEGNSISNDVDYVTITIGGNDLDFVGVVTEVAKGGFYNKYSDLYNKLALAKKQLKEGDDGNVRGKLKKTYNDLLEKFPNAEIIVAGYPKLFDPSGKGLLISKNEAQDVNKDVHYFNTVIKKIIKEIGDKRLHFVSVEKAFEGHAAYSGDSAYINKIIPGKKSEDLKEKITIDQKKEIYDVASAYSMHPNLEGAKAYARCVQKKITDLEDKKNKSNPKKDKDKKVDNNDNEDFDSNGNRLYTYVISESKYNGHNSSYYQDIEKGRYYSIEVPPVSDLRHPEYRFMYPGMWNYGVTSYFYDMDMHIPRTTKTIGYQDGYDEYFFGSDGRIARIDMHATGDGDDKVVSSSTFKVDELGRTITETIKDYGYYGGSNSQSDKEVVYHYNEYGSIVSVTGDLFGSQYDYEEIGSPSDKDYDCRVCKYQYEDYYGSYEGKITYSKDYQAYPRNGIVYVEGTGLPYNSEKVTIYYENDFCKKIELKSSTVNDITLEYEYERVKMD